MKIKNILAAAVAAGIVMAPAAANAKSADELRIYINPGHGSWTGGDRNMGTIKHGEPRNEADTCGFFESNTNLWKCLGVVDRLAEYGLKLDRTVNQDNPVRALQGCARDLSQNIFMSRVKNGPVPGSGEDEEAYNRSLYEISCEVQRNNFDMFLSVHSNAAGDDMVNYPAFFLRGENKVASVPGSDTNAAIAWPYAYAQGHHNWTNYSMERPNVIYDIDFWQGDHLITNIDGVDYKGYYGVLRHGVMGYMVEGYFHTYGPDRHRAMNVDVCHDEGDAYARGIAAIFDIPMENNGTIYGIVRDKHERFRHKYYNTTARCDDNYKPLNNVKVNLLQNGNVVATYTTDDEWNGAFVFDHLTPGEYFIDVEAEGYKAADAADCGPFVVEAAKTLYPDVWLENVNYVPEEVAVEDYPDPVNGDAIHAADSYRMRTAVEAKEIAELAGKTVRRILARNGNLYVLALDAEQKPTVLVLDADLNVTGTLGTTVCKGSDRDLSDIQFSADGILLGASESITHYSSETIDSDFGDTARGSVNFYRWANDANGNPTGEASIWFTSLASGNLFRGATANTFVYKGTTTDGMFFFPTASSYGVGRMFFSYVEVMGGEVQNFTIQNCGLNTDYLCTEYLGHDYTFTLAPYDTDLFVVNAPGKPVRAFDIHEIEAAGTLDAAHMADAMAGANFFKYAGHSYLASASATAPALVDATAGLDHAAAAAVTVDGTATADEAAAVMAVGTASAHNNDEGITTSANIDLYVLADGKLARYTTAGVEQEAVAGVFAYGLKSNQSDGLYTLEFSLSGAARARVELSGEGLETVVIPAENYAAGANHVVVNANELPEGAYSWSVVVENKAVPAAAAIFTDNTTQGNGVAVNSNPESAAFGTAYYSARTPRAVFSMTPGFAFSSPYLQNQGWDTSVGASPWRLALLPNGKLLISDWSDAHGGIYLWDPAQPETPYTNFFAGTINSGSGEWTYEGKVIGGSTSGLAVAGTGDETKLYTFQEDYPSNYTLTMACYNIGTAEQITAVPETTYPALSSHMLNGNVDVLLADDFMVLSQVRGAGNNTKAVPSFIIANYDDEELFNSADLTLAGSDGAIALTADATRLLVMDCNDDIHVYDIDLTAEENKLTEAYVFTPSAAGEAYQMTFDHAGNLLIAGRSAFQAYTLPREAVETVTPAPAADIINGLSGVENIEIEGFDANDAPAEYFNLQGIRVAADQLTPGFYIERRGNSARKIMVR